MTRLLSEAKVAVGDRRGGLITKAVGTTMAALGAAVKCMSPRAPGSAASRGNAEGRATLAMENMLEGCTGAGGMHVGLGWRAECDAGWVARGEVGRGRMFLVLMGGHADQ